MKFIILGCGSSMGVPRSDGYFGKCNPKNKKNYRSRCSALLQTKNENILIDTSPDLRTQLLKNKITNIDKVLYSHMHADQTHGINDLRVFFIKNKKQIPVFADYSTMKYLSKTFAYCFESRNNEYPATLKINKMRNQFIIKDGKKRVIIKSVIVKHGKVDCNCFIIDKKLAYISDVSYISKHNYKFFKNLKYLIIDCLWYRDHPSHLNFNEVMNLINIFSPKKAILTNLHSDLDYNDLKKKLPKNVLPAHDNLSINL